MWIYLSHPCVPAEYSEKGLNELTGEEKVKVTKIADDNREQASFIARNLQKTNPEHLIISPLNAGSFIIGNRTEHLEYDFGLLEKCQGIIFAGGWKSSLGCMAEYGFAKAKGMKRFTYDINFKLKEAK